MPTYKESEDSQQSTLDLLQKIGYTYLTPEEVNIQREGRFSRVLLKGILQQQLERLNNYDYRGQIYEFSSANIDQAVRFLQEPMNDGLPRINQNIFELLLRGRGFEEIVQGTKKSFTLQYIDWHNWENNVFHVTQEMSVRGLNHTNRVDVVLFVNGIPFVIIENKRSDKKQAVKEGISQQIRNQREVEGIPRLFYYSQLLLSVQPNKVAYGTTCTPSEFWSVWKEPDLDKALAPYKDGFLPTEQDRSLYALCRPERLLELVQKFIVYDGKLKKIARYQQYFAIKATIERIQNYQNNQGKRQGGVIWHTQGSGKSLTMVMLSKAIKLDRRFPKSRIVIVTDRVSLDDQIHKTFHQCGIKSLEKATSGSQLASLMQDDSIEVVTAIVNKFGSTKHNIDYSNPSNNIFVLIDESHRSQYGQSHGYLKRMLPNACLIGFTGTPLNKKEKSTAKKFGGFIHQYTIDQAVEDGAVLPILYEGRNAKLSVHKKALDKRIERVEEELMPYQTEAEKNALRKKHANVTAIYGSTGVIEEIANDIAEHFNKNIKDGRSKGQLAVHNINTAIKYHQYFEDNKNRLKINASVVFSPPTVKKEHEDVWKDVKEGNKRYWDSLVEPHGNQKAYEQHIITKFKESGTEVELIIVVDKLLTGFDAPNNTVLYLVKPLSDHNLLQAIARVNRLFEGKEYGYVIDYMGILGKLDKALTDYAELSGFDEEDISGALLHAREVVILLPEYHHQLQRVFENINIEDKEAMERHLEPQDIRDEFHQRLSTFARGFQTAVAVDEFYTSYDDATRLQWIKDLKFFLKLKASVCYRFDEVFDFKEYKYRIQQLMDRFVLTDEIEQLTEPINIFNEELRSEELLKGDKTPASLADHIAHRMKHSVTERMEEDPAYYKKFSELLEEVIDAFEKGRIIDTEFLKRILDLQKDLNGGLQKGIPTVLQQRPKARAFYGIIEEVLKERTDIPNIPEEALAELCLSLDNSIQKIATVDWQKNPSKLLDIANCVDDYLLDKSAHLGFTFEYAEVDRIIEFSKTIAKANY